MNIKSIEINLKKIFTNEEIERLEEIGDFYCSSGEMIPAECFINEPKGSLSLIPNYEDGEEIF